MQLFKQSAKANDVNGQVGLGNTYLNGIGVEKNYDEAYCGFSKSVAQNYRDALYKLVHMFEKD